VSTEGSRPAELDEIEAFLAERGFKMEVDIGSIPGEGHDIVSLTEDRDFIVDIDALPNEVLVAARRWSELIDQWMEEQ
jgi:hypothetical protein